MTSGPTVPARIGNVIDGEPSEKVRRGGAVGHDVRLHPGFVRLRSIPRSIVRPAGHRRSADLLRGLSARGLHVLAAEPASRRAQRGDAAGASVASPGSARPASRSHSSLSREVEQPVERRDVRRRDIAAPRASRKPREDQVVLQHSAPAAPAQAVERAASAPGAGRAAATSGRARCSTPGPSSKSPSGPDPVAFASRASCACPALDRPLDHDVLDLADRLRRVEPLRAHVDAVHDRVAAEQPVRVLEVVEALVDRLVARVGDEAVGGEQPGRTDELVRVPPERRAGGRAAGAEDALVEPVELLAVLGRLQPLLLGRAACR